MEDCWQFYRFDYIRYQTLRPALRSATTAAAFAVLAEDPETEAITNALMDGTITVQEARSAFVQSVCCLGDPLNLASGLPRSITALARWRETEDAADILAELLTSRKNMEAWLSPASAIIGMLKPDETLTLQKSYAALNKRKTFVRSGNGAKKIRRGGLVNSCVGIANSLLDRGPQIDDMLSLLGGLIEEAAMRGEGIAVLAV